MLDVLDIYQESKAVSYSHESPLRYPGGKSRAVQIITRFFPKGLKTLCAPFLGGGSVELHCAALGVQVYGYDSFLPLVDFWQCLLENPTELADTIETYHPLSKEEFCQLQNQQMSLTTRLERAAVFFALNRASFSGSTLSGGMSPNHPRFTPASIDKCRVFQNPNIQVEQGDFQETIPRHANDLLYLDPPYWMDNHLYGNKGELHRDFDHEALAILLKQRHQWILSYNDCEAIRQLYDGYRQVMPNWKYGMPNDKTSNEVLIFSHDLTVNDIDFESKPVFQLPAFDANEVPCDETERLQLERLESIIEKGLKAFVEVGEALLEIRESRLYREQYRTFEEYCQKRWGIGIRQSQRLIRASKVVQNLKKGDQLVALPTSELQVRTLSTLEPDEQRTVWQHVTQSGEPITGKKVEESIQALRQNGETPKLPPVHFTSESYEWYTPPEIIHPTLAVLDNIDLDPCSNSTINPNVPATKHFTKDIDGLAQDWQGKVYLNPPYGRGIENWIEKLVLNFDKGAISEAIALTPARTDTAWFALLRDYPRCFIRGRLNFSEAENTAPFPSCVFYLGNQNGKFKTVFGELGDVFRLM